MPRRGLRKPKDVVPQPKIFHVNSPISTGPEGQVNEMEKFIRNEKEVKANDEEETKKIHENILMNFDSTRYLHHVALCGILGGVFLGFLGTFTITLLPCHNVIAEPQYWYEFWLQCELGFLPLFAAVSIFNSSSWMNTEAVKNVKNYIRLYMVGFVSSTISISSVYYFWRFLIQYPHPMPFQGVLLAFELLMILYIHLWYQFPKALRVNNSFRKRLKFTFHALLISGLVPFQYQIITIFFLKVSPEYQWGVAFCLPIIRELNLALMLKMTKIASAGKFSRVSCSVSHYMNSRHALYVAIIIGTIATFETSLVILGIDFLINLYISIKLIYLRKWKTETTRSEQVELLQELVLNEHVEFIMPISYFVVFLAAYYGPNGQYIGNIKYGGWAFHAITEIENFYNNIAQLFFADLSSLLLCAVLLWLSCKINIFRAYYQMVKKGWIEMAIQTAFLLDLVSNMTNFSPSLTLL